MSFLHPWMLGLLALGGLIWLLHARQRIETEVSSLFIWERVRQRRTDRQVTSWRPRINRLMVLQLLALLLIALALAEPIFGANRHVDHWIYVLDNSASMQAGGPDAPAERAMAVLSERLQAADPAARRSLLVAGVEARAVFADQPVGAEHLDARLADIFPEDGTADWAGVRNLVHALSQPGEATRIVVLTDGDVPGDIAGLEGAERLVFEGPSGNAGLSAQLVPGADAGAMAVRGVVRFTGGLTSAELVVEFYADGADSALELGRQPIALEGAEAGAVSFALGIQRPGDDGIVAVRLGDDALDMDNRAYFNIHGQAAALKVLYLGADDHPLVRVLAALGSVDLTIAAEGDADTGAYDLVVANGVAPTPRTAANLVLIGAANGEQMLDQTGFEPTGWRQAHPLAQAVDWSSISIERAVELPSLADATVLAGYEGHALADISSTDTGLLVRLAFDPLASNWPERSDFVVFFDQLIRRMVPEAGALIDPACVVGQPCALGSGLTGARLQRIDRSEGAVAPVADPWVPNRAGLFELTSDSRTRLLAIHPPAITDALPAEAATRAAELPARPLVLWPWLLGLGMLVLGVEAVLAHRRKRRRTDWLRANGLRLAALGLAALAVVNLRLPFPTTEQAVIVVAPSASAAQLQGEGHRVLAYRDILDPAPAGAEGRMPLVAGGLADAVGLAHAMLPQDRPGVLIGAGRVPSDQTRIAALAGRLAGRDIVVDGLTLSPPPSDVWAAALAVPDRVYPTDSFALQAIVGAAEGGEADIEITENGQAIHSQRLALAPGENRIAIPVTVAEAGPVVYEMTVTAAADPEPGNNRIGQVLNVADPGRVAVLSGEPTSGVLFARTMAGQGFEVEVLDPATVPQTPEGWRAYDALALMNLPASSLFTDQQRAIETAVRRDGLGLLVLGGANSFGPGGYLETPLDLVSPISSRVPRDKPGVALVFVLDRSSSMSQQVGPVTRLDIAKQATMAAARLLDEDSSVGVVTFDSGARLALPLTSVANMGFIERSINQISLGGGTALQRGLSAGYDQIRRADASARHIVVMTDGLSQPSDYSVLMRSIARDEITVSTVAIGEEAEHEILDWLAREGGGIFHATTDFEALPSILSQEAMQLSGDAFEIVAAQPEWVEDRPGFLEGLPDALPQIGGYVLASTKPDAHTLATVNDTTGQPVPYLAYWQYGLGHVMALTTDAFGGWTAQWQEAADYPRLFSQALRAFMPPTQGDAMRVRSHQDALGLHVQLAGLRSPDLPRFSTLDAGEGAAMLSLASAREGEFGALYQPPGAGPAFFHMEPDGPDFGAYVNYPAHLNPDATVDGGALLATLTGGRLLAAGQPYARPIEPYWTQMSIWPLLAGAALALFLLDLVIRYSGLSLFARRAASRTH